jgi:hypothetical protein
MADEEANLTAEELVERERSVIEDEDDEGVEHAPDESLDTPTDMSDGGIEDDSGYLEDVVEDGDPILQMPDGTRVGAGSPG